MTELAVWPPTRYPNGACDTSDPVPTRTNPRGIGPLPASWTTSQCPGAAGAGQPSAVELDPAGEIVPRGEVDVGAGDPRLPEEGKGRRRAADNGGELPPREPVQAAEPAGRLLERDAAPDGRDLALWGGQRGDPARDRAIRNRQRGGEHGRE